MIMMEAINGKILVEECPSLDWTCPYYENGECRMRIMENGADPHEECDEFYGIE